MAMNKRACCLLLAVAALLASAHAVCEADTQVEMIFPGVGAPLSSDVTIVCDDLRMRTVPIPMDEDMVGGCLRLSIAEESLQGADNLRYYGENESFGAILRNQIIAYRSGSAAVARLSFEALPEAQVVGLMMEIPGFSMIGLSGAARLGEPYTLFYGIGDSILTVSLAAITEERYLPLGEIALDTAATGEQRMTLETELGEIKICATVLPMEQFLLENAS